MLILGIIPRPVDKGRMKSVTLRAVHLIPLPILLPLPKSLTEASTTLQHLIQTKTIIPAIRGKRSLVAE
jgi:hypothetical protein